MSRDAEEDSRAKLKNNSDSIQADESTEVTNISFVLAFVRFVNDCEIQENFSCPKQANGKIESCFHFWKHWENCTGICTGGALPSENFVSLV
jgi:hypothetical protein